MNPKSTEKEQNPLKRSIHVMSTQVSDLIESCLKTQNPQYTPNNGEPQFKYTTEDILSKIIDQHEPYVRHLMSAGADMDAMKYSLRIRIQRKKQKMVKDGLHVGFAPMHPEARPILPRLIAYKEILKWCTDPYNTDPLKPEEKVAIAKAITESMGEVEILIHR